MRAVVYTEALQTVVLLFGAASLTFIGLDVIGGWGELKATVTPEYFDMWRPADDPDYPWPSLLFTSSIVGIWYWCTDQYIVQRVLTAKDLKEGRRGTIWGGLSEANASIPIPDTRRYCAGAQDERPIGVGYARSGFPRFDVGYFASRFKRFSCCRVDGGIDEFIGIGI